MRISGNFSKKTYRFRIGVNSNISQFQYIQKINNAEIESKRVNQDFGVEIKTAYNKWPDVSIKYAKGYGMFSRLTKSKFNSDAITSNFSHTFLKNWTFSIDYDYLQNTNDNGLKNNFAIASTSLRYYKKNSPFGLQLTTNNLFNTIAKNNYSFSDFIISEQQTFILPRIILLGFQYKL